MKGEGEEEISTQDVFAIVHPCFDYSASQTYARIHLPVAPKCNLQCNYCNKKYDCPNENPAGVTTKVLSPLEAVRKVRMAKKKFDNLTVVGIAGPGEPLANQETFQTLSLVYKYHPDLQLCLATNGLLAPLYVNKLRSLGVQFVTISIAALDPFVGKKIYSWVRWNGNVFSGEFAFKVLSQNQWEAVRMFVDAGVLVRINSVYIPGINDDQISKIAKKASEMGAHTLNITSLEPVRGSAFQHRRPPSKKEVELIRNYCESTIPKLKNCQNCSPNSMGSLRKDISVSVL